MFKSLCYKLERVLIYCISPLSPKLASKIMFFLRFKRRLNLKAPKTLNEKIMWLKLNTYRDNESVTECADKYGVREYVRSRGCGDALNDIYGAWERVEDIRWEKLPEAFVLKCSHGCGYNLFFSGTDKPDITKSKKLLKKWIRSDYWRLYAEIQYKNIPKKIICEKFIGDKDDLPIDYKVYCFNGKPLYILVCLQRTTESPRFFFFDNRWNFCPITRDGLKVSEDFTVPKPKFLSKMLDYSEKLSEPFPFVRVDFYETNDKLIFGELTFTPSAALDTGRLTETDVMFGSMLMLP